MNASELFYPAPTQNDNRVIQEWTIQNHESDGVAFTVADVKERVAKDAKRCPEELGSFLWGILTTS